MAEIQISGAGDISTPEEFREKNSYRGIQEEEEEEELRGWTPSNFWYPFFDTSHLITVISLSRLPLFLSLWLPDLAWLNHGKPYIIGKQRTYGVHRRAAWLFVCDAGFYGVHKTPRKICHEYARLPREVGQYLSGNSFPDISPLRILSTDRWVAEIQFRNAQH